jgi:hypothetical protein
MALLQQCTDFEAGIISKQGGPHYRIHEKADQKVGGWRGGLVV